MYFYYYNHVILLTALLVTTVIDIAVNVSTEFVSKSYNCDDNTIDADSKMIYDNIYN